jgi:dinuclear metal center YbgI/SA1388 family protein
MPAKRDEIIAFCDEYLKVKDFEDKCHNGLQVEGKSEIKKIVTGVSLSRELIQQALDRGADMLLVHHGYFSKGIPSPLQLRGYRKERLKMLLENDLNLAGYHLPLDAHPIIGNNISLCKLLKVTKVKPLYVGFIGELAKPLESEKFCALVDEKLQVRSFSLAAGKPKVKRVAVISGGASPEAELAAAAGADAYVTGDIREDLVRTIEELGINFINAGHYNTEKEGIRNLGALVAKKFKVKAEFVDVPNEV